MTLTWPLIPYQADGGFYEISSAPTPLGPFTVHGHTLNKWSTSYAVPDLAPGATDYSEVAASYYNPPAREPVEPRRQPADAHAET